MTSKLSGVTKLTEQEKIAAFNMAIHCIHTMHAVITPRADHVTETLKCDCVYGVSVRNLVNLRRRAYQAVREAVKR